MAIYLSVHVILYILVALSTVSGGAANNDVMQNNVVYESVEARDEKLMINVNSYAAVAER